MESFEVVKSAKIEIWKHWINLNKKILGKYTDITELPDVFKNSKFCAYQYKLFNTEIQVHSKSYKGTNAVVN